MWPWQAIFSLTIIIVFVLYVVVTLPTYWAQRNSLYLRQLAPEYGLLTTAYNILVVTTICTQCILISLTNAGYDVPDFPNQLMCIVSFLAVPCFSTPGSLRGWQICVRYDVALRKTKLVNYLNKKYQIKQLCIVLTVCMCIVGICLGSFNRYNRVSRNIDGYTAHYYHEWYLFIAMTVISLRFSKKLSAGLRSMHDSYGIASVLRRSFALVVGMTAPYYMINIISDACEWSGYTGFNRNEIELNGLPLDYWIVLLHIIYYHRVIILAVQRANTYNAQYRKTYENENSVTRDSSTYAQSRMESTELLGDDLFSADIIYNNFDDDALQCNIDGVGMTDQGMIVNIGDMSERQFPRISVDRPSVDSVVHSTRPSDNTVTVMAYDVNKVHTPRSQTNSIRNKDLLGSNTLHLQQSKISSVPMPTRTLQATPRALTPNNASNRPSFNNSIRSAKPSHSKSHSYDSKATINSSNKPQKWNCIRALRDPDMFKLLELHAKKSLNSEYTEFWAELNAYKEKWYMAKAQKQNAQATHSVSHKHNNEYDMEIEERFKDQPMQKREFCVYICNKYIRINSPFQVNISDAMRQKFEKMVSMTDTQIVDEITGQRNESVAVSSGPTRTQTHISVDIPVTPNKSPLQSNTVFPLPNTVTDDTSGTDSAAQSPFRPKLPLLQTPYTQPVDPMRLHGQQLFVVLLEIQREIYKLINTNLWVTFKRSEVFTSRNLQSIEDTEEKNILRD